MIDFDTYKEIYETITRNKSRSLLTGFGVFWGVFMLVFLIGGGRGLKGALSNNFQGFATNSAFIIAQPTTKAYQGFRKGRQWYMNYGDVDRLKMFIPELDVVSPILMRQTCTMTYGENKSSCHIIAENADYQNIETPMLRYGRFINEMDIKERRKVCVIGKKIYKDLFTKGGDPCGKIVRADSLYYRVVGVDYSSSNFNLGGQKDNQMTVPFTLMQEVYNMGSQLEIIALTARPGYKISSLIPRMRQVVGSVHQVDSTDEKALFVINTEAMFGMLDALFGGVNFLIWLVGIGTLLAGAIGVSNIMMVTVKERTTEIGIRRAIGATPMNILGQIMSESLLLTAVAGLSGILFAVMLLQLIEMGNTVDGIVQIRFQIEFWTAIGSVVLLGILGVLAGLAPALRALAIKPVDAMREE
jgi:putative ABC transport system permease protein